MKLNKNEMKTKLKCKLNLTTYINSRLTLQLPVGLLVLGVGLLEHFVLSLNVAV